MNTEIFATYSDFFCILFKDLILEYVTMPIFTSSYIFFTQLENQWYQRLG